MNVMYSLTLRQMLKQKRRTIITILGVIVAVAMITAVSSFAATFMGLFQQVEIESEGAWHAAISGVDPEGRALLAADEKVRDVFVIGRHGDVKFPEKVGRYTRMELFSLDETGRRVMNVSLAEGRWPDAAGEIAVSADFAEKAGLSLGDVLTALDLADEETAYTIVGTAYMQPLQSGASGTAYGLAPWSEDEAPGEEAETYLTFVHPDRSIYAWLQAKCEEIPDEQAYRTHTALLGYMGVSSHDDLTAALYLMEGIIMTIIIAAAVALIYNAFAISVTDRSAIFGMLASVGATKKQRRHAVLFEAFVIALIAIPFGLFFGYLGIGVTFRVVSSLLGEMANTLNSAKQPALHLVIEPTATLMAAALALLTVLISAWIPARRAARVSPMEAIRRTQDVKLSGKKVRTSRLVRLLFGFEGELAAKNLKRNRKRYRITTLSLAMSLILFLSAYSFTSTMRSSYDQVNDNTNYNLIMTAFFLRSTADGTARYEGIDDLKTQAMNAAYVDRAAAYTRYWDNVTASLPQGNGSQYLYTQQALSYGGDILVDLVAMDDAALKEYAQAIGADMDALMNAGEPAAILINGGTLYDGQKFTPLTVLEISQGEEMPVNFQFTFANADGGTSEKYEETRLIRLAGVTDTYPDDLKQTLSRPQVMLILSEAAARAMLPRCAPRLEIAFFSETPDKAEEALQDIQEAFSLAAQGMTGDEIQAAEKEGRYLWVSLQNYEALRQTNMRLMTIVNIFVYGFITLLSMVGAANIVGTISTSLMLRKRELAMVKSVGMGPGQFDRMIATESLFYGLKAVLWGCAGSMIAITLMWLAMRGAFVQAFTVPWPQMLIGVAAIFLLVAATMVYSVSKIRRDTIVEDLRLE